MEITNEEYPFKEKLIKLCKSFENQEITINATFMGKNIPIYNCNLIGNILEDIFYPLFKEELPDFEKGPKQLSPDYYGNNKKYEFELKALCGFPLSYKIPNNVDKYDLFGNMVIPNVVEGVLKCIYSF